MAEIVGEAAKASGILNEAFTSSENVRRLPDRKYNVRQFDLDLNASLQKFQAWQNTWYGDEAPLEAEAMWGVTGWEHIHRMLDVIGDTSKKLAGCLEQMHMFVGNNPWKRAYKSIQARQGLSSKMQDLQNYSKNLGRAVDQLWIYSEAVFDSIHSAPSVESRLPERDRLLQTALRSRPSSLELHRHCSREALHYLLETDLLEPGSPDNMASSTLSGDSLPMYYHLITKSPRGDHVFKKATIENVEAPTTLRHESNDVVVQDMENLRLFERESHHSVVLVKVNGHGSTQPSHLRISQNRIESMNLYSSPESLSDILGKMQSATLSTKEHLSTGSKVELAFKLVECALFLLGTPWLAGLSSYSVIRLKDTRKKHHTFYLETQTLDLEDLLHDDPGA